MQKRRSFAAGAFTLAVSGMLVRVIGACYRIPMTNMIGEDGIALYQYAYPVFGLLLALTTAGIPPAMSKRVSELLSRGEEARAGGVFRVCLGLLALVGFAGAAVLFAAAPVVAQWVGDPLAELPLRAVSPAVFFVAILSAFRGYLQGQQRMTPTALTQITEQLGKLVLGLGLAWLLRERGPEYAAAGAILGMTLSELLAVVVVMVLGAGRGRRASREPVCRVLGELLPTALPMMGIALLMPLVGMADSFVVNRRLLALGYSAQEARALYGLMTGPVNTLINMPSVIPVAISTALVPAIAQACARGARLEVRHKTQLSVKLALTFSLPAAVALAALAEPLMGLLYGGLLPERQMQTAELLQVTSPAVVSLAVVQVLSGVLQGMGRVRSAAAALAAGVMLKIITTYALTGILKLNITGACVGTVVCYSIAAIISLHRTGKILGQPVGGLSMVLQPLAAGGMMAWAMELTLRQSTALHELVQLLLAGTVGLAVYGAALWMVGGITKDEIRSITGHRGPEDAGRSMG